MKNVKNTSKAFSLIELLVGLLVITIVFAAMVPVMTKAKKDYSISPLSKAQEGRYVVWYKDGSGATVQFPKPDDINIPTSGTLFLTMIGGGGGGGGAAREARYLDTDSLNDGILTESGSWTVPEGAINVRVTLQGAGGGGGKGDGTILPGTEEYFIPDVYNKGSPLCIKRFNIGDIPSLLPTYTSPYDHRINKLTRYLTNAPEEQRGGIAKGTTPEPITSLDTGGQGGQTDKINACLYSGTTNTATDCFNDGAGAGYSGCNRTVCTHSAAHNSCAALDGGWRLPSYQEIVNMASRGDNHVNNKGINLCSESASAPDMSQCKNFANDYGGRISRFWITSISSDPGHVERKYCDILNESNIKLTPNGCQGNDNTPKFDKNEKRTASTRCVKNTTACSFQGRSGSGGGGGAYVTLTLPSVQPGDVIEYTIGLGGKGGEGQDGKGQDGGSTSITVKRGTEVLYTVSATGGKGGNPATSTSNGAGVDGVVAVWDKEVVTVNHKPGGKSEMAGGDAMNNTSVSKGGDSGAREAYNAIGGLGAGHPQIIEEGPDAEYKKSDETLVAHYGAGGAGGYYITNTPGSGARGFAEIQYDVVAPGGGGGAGAWLYNFEVDAGAIPDITSSEGPRVGASGMAGAPGSETSIKIGSKTRYVVAGGKPGFSGKINSDGTIAPGGTSGNNTGTNNAAGGAKPTVADCNNRPDNCNAGRAGSPGDGYSGGAGGGSFDFEIDENAQVRSITGLGLQGGTSGCKKPTVDTTAICTGTMAPLFNYMTKLGGGAGGNGIACWRTGCETTRGGDGFIFISW